MRLFIASGIAREYEYKNPTFVMGMSGPELVNYVFEKVGLIKSYTTSTDITNQKTKEYWSGVSLRAIQMYEQLNKDIRKANVTSVVRLERTLGCTVEDLIEY